MISSLTILLLSSIREVFSANIVARRALVLSPGRDLLIAMTFFIYTPPREWALLSIAAVPPGSSVKLDRCRRPLSRL